MSLLDDAGSYLQQVRPGSRVLAPARRAASLTFARISRICSNDLVALRGSKLRLVGSTTKRSAAGSIQISVPVHPVCPKVVAVAHRP